MVVAADLRLDPPPIPLHVLPQPRYFGMEGIPRLSLAFCAVFHPNV